MKQASERDFRYQVCKFFLEIYPYTIVLSISINFLLTLFLLFMSVKLAFQYVLINNFIYLKYIKNHYFFDYRNKNNKIMNIRSVVCNSLAMNVI